MLVMFLYIVIHIVRNLYALLYRWGSEYFGGSKHIVTGPFEMGNNEVEHSTKPQTYLSLALDLGSPFLMSSLLKLLGLKFPQFGAIHPPVLQKLPFCQLAQR